MNQLIPTYRGSVQVWHCDHMGHMNVMWYVGKFDEATWNLLAMMGITGAYMRDNKRCMVAVDQRVQYKRELLAGDTLTIASGVTQMGQKSLQFFHEMRKAESGEIAATVRFTGVQIDAETRKAVPFDEALRLRSRQFLRDYDFGERLAA